MKTIGLLAFAVMFVLAGCAPAESGTGPKVSTQSNEDPSLVRKKAFALVDWKRLDLQEVKVSRSQRFGSVYPAVLGTFVSEEDLALFEEAFRSAEKIEGVLDVAMPEYDLTFSSKDGETGFHLWLGQSPGRKGLYTYVEDTGTGYTISEEYADRLRQLIRSIRYGPEQAISNGDIVNLHGELSNLQKWTQFVDQVRQGNRGEAHLTTYTIEGDPIFQDLLFDGEVIQFAFDNTMDGFGTPTRSNAFCKNLEEDDQVFTLSKCDREGPAFYFSARPQ
nr:DUF4362 domain-containing protein [Cohnella terricola]